MTVGLGSDVAAGPEISMFSVMRAGAVTQRVLELTGGADRDRCAAPLDWLRLGTLEGARVLGLEGAIGSLEAGKEADVIVDRPALHEPAADAMTRPRPPTRSPAGSCSGPHPDMVRGAWVRGRLLAGPPGLAGIG